ncbi:MAG: hypothetical protein HDS10_04695 [Bacteroides sp.]|nr:hypothetical protein [Bacteroides sp.]
MKLLNLCPIRIRMIQEIRTFISSIVFILVTSFTSHAQLNGQFVKGQDGHIYFQAINTTGYAFPVTITATSSDRTNSETFTVVQGFILGPSTPWAWYWKSGDRISVTYPNGQGVYWQCNMTDGAYNSSSPSFRGTDSDGYIFQGTIELMRVGSGNVDVFYHFKKGTISYVSTSKSGPYIKLSKRLKINNIDYICK